MTRTPPIRPRPSGPSASARSLSRQADLAAMLTGRDRWLLWMLYEHRVLTTTQISTLAFTATRRASRRLLTLHDNQVIDRFRPRRDLGTAPWHWILAPAGAAVLAGEHGLDVRELRWRHDRTLALAHSLRLNHDIGVHDWFTRLATRPASEMTLTAWWSPTRCARLWGDLARPDAYGRLDPARPGQRGLEFFLEYDCGTEPLTRVCSKLTGYAELAAATGITTPLLLWLPTTRREATARTALRAAAAALSAPDTVPIATAAADYATTGPDGPVWLPLHPPATARQPRLTLHQLTAAWPQLPDTNGSAFDIASPAVDPRTVLPPPPPRPPRDARP